MERHILSVILRDRESFSLVSAHLTPKLYSREFQILLGFIKSYYDRDSKATHVETSLLEEQVTADVRNEKHRDKFLGMLQEAVAFDTSDSNVKQVVLKLKQRELGQELALAIANDKDHEDLLNEYSEVSRYTSLDDLLEKGVEVYENTDLDELIHHDADSSSRMIVYPLSLNERLDGGLRGSDHLVLMARPEMGKTGLILTMACGFARHGHRGIIFNNEERVERLRMRALCCSTGMTIQEIRANPEAAKDIADQMGYHNIIFIALSPGVPAQVAAFVDKYKPKWFIADQIRNFAMKSENRTNQLEAASTAMRDIGKRFDAAAISVTQAGDSAEGKAVLDMSDVDNSKTGIPGSCDVLLGVGATEEQKLHNVRVLSLSKNKIGGVHDSFPVRFNPFLSKYVSAKGDH
jgi:KaiC/GvpD/RAD55 family RecA-like ATPase